MNENGTTQIIDFQYSPEPKRFRLEPDVFEACPDLPVDLLSFVSNFQGLTLKDPDIVERLLEFFDVILLDESARRFRERVQMKNRNIGVMTMMQIIPRLLEEYGLRPTQPSSDSSTPSTELSGTSSTVGALSGASILWDSASPASST